MPSFAFTNVIIILRCPVNTSSQDRDRLCVLIASATKDAARGVKHSSISVENSEDSARERDLAWFLFKVLQLLQWFHR